MRKWPRTYLQALDYQKLGDDWPLYPRILTWLAHLNNSNKVKLADTEIQILADALCDIYLEKERSLIVQEKVAEAIKLKRGE